MNCLREGCGHPRPDHINDVGECCATTDERGLIYCDCKALVQENTVTLDDALADVLRPRSERLAEQQAAADQSIQQAEDAADAGWLVDAETALHVLAASREPFTTDDVWDWLAVNRPGLVMREKRAIGGVVRRLRRHGYLRATGEYRLSHRRHGSPLPVYTG